MHTARVVQHPASGVANNEGDAQCASHASGVEACREQGEAPQGSQAGRVDGANSIGSGVAGPYNPPSPAGEQPSEVSKPRHYKHHSSAAAPQKSARATLRPGAKRVINDEPKGQPEATRHHGNPTAAGAAAAQPAHASNAAPPMPQQPTPVVQPPMPPNGDMPPTMPPMGPYQPTGAAAYMGHPMMLMQDPKFWQAVQAGLMPPPPMPPFFALGSPWQLVNMLAGQQMLSAAAASTWGGPAPSTQSLAPTTTYAGAHNNNNNKGGMLGDHHHGGAGHGQQPSTMAQTCKEQVRQMAAAGLPSEVQIEAAARSKAAELGEPALAQMLMAWYYAGYFTGQQGGGVGGGGGG